MMTTFPPRVLSSGILFTTYQYIYSHYSLHPLAWDSTSTWILAAVGIDFCYYWVHRAAHGETNWTLTRSSKVVGIMHTSGTSLFNS